MDITDGHTFPYKVEVDLDMLHALAGGVEGVVWGAAEVMGAARGVAEVSEADNERAAQVLVVEPPTMAV
jgi:hypothetical protein